MSDHNAYEETPLMGGRDPYTSDEVVVYVVPEPVPEPPPKPPPMRHSWGWPLILFLATCASTYFVAGPIYALCVMTILVCHEMGHFVQTLRYGVYSSLPYFLPLPISPIGTLGAVIGMSSNINNRRALFDIGISGPLAGLVPTLIFCVLGLKYGTQPGPATPPDGAVIWQFGEPILFKFLAWMQFGTLPEGQTLYIGPMAMAGWVGMFITALNLFPIGQLDGGHVLYALLRQKAHFVATFVLVAAIALVILFGYYGWTLMLVLLVLVGPKHPPTGNDEIPLGTGRAVLGWLTLCFLFLGFTPNPLQLLTP